MTSLALLAGHRMRSGLISSGTDAVVTPRAVTRLPRHCAVVKQNLQPIGGVVTHIASLGRRYMCRVLAKCDSAVVARRTRIGGLGVIERHYVRLPSQACGMTRLAQIRSHRMSGGFISGIGAGMTDRACRRGLIMREWYD